MSGFELTSEQEAILRDFGGQLFVSAGAGSGKTSIVIDGIVKALETGMAGVDQVLAITFTEKAAGQMVKQARKELAARGMLEERRQIELAHISTIHSFCSGLIRSHALALGLDPEFSVADEAQSELIKEEAFNRCLEDFIREQGQAAVKLMFDIDPSRQGRLFTTVISIFDELRSRGQARPHYELPHLDEDSARNALREAVAGAFAALEAAGSKAKEVESKLSDLLRALDEPDPGKRLELVLENLPSLKCKAKEAIQLVRERRSDFLGALHLHVLKQLQELLDIFSDEYTRRKREAGLLDFEDLQLEALKLLRENRGIRERVAESFRIIVVDEFQDTNGLQCDIIDEIARDNVCFVGDENQSIYRFRHANVDLFRQKKHEAAAAGALRPLATNFRSQREILDFVDFVFGQEGMLGGSGYLGMTAGADPDDNGDPARVEVIMVDFDSHDSDKVNVAEARSAEAELVARRLHELYSSGLGYAAGDTVILLRKSQDADRYRQALDRWHIPNYLSIGRDYYRKLELGDAMSLLRLLVNPNDDTALLGVLRSLMVGITDDTLLVLRLMAGKGSREAGPPPLWPTVKSPGCIDRLPPEQGEKLGGFISEYEAMRSNSRRQSLEKTVRAVIDYHDYACLAAAMPDGRRSYANLLKLVDLAADYEEAWGRDLASFVEFLSQQHDRDVKEGDAPTEEEGSGSVQIMTIHAAKGLEFPVVVWGFMGDGSSHRPGLLAIGDQGNVGLNWKPLGKRQEDRFLFDYQSIDEHDEAKELEEEKRIGYVAMTRARRHLILAGATNVSKPPEGAGSRVSFEWVKRALDLHSGNSDLEALFAQPVLAERTTLDGIEGCPVFLTVCTDPEAVIKEAGEEAEALAVDKVEAVGSDVDDLPEPAKYVPSYISASSLSVFRKCPRRFYLERELGLSIDAAESPAAPGGGEPDRLPSNQMGSLVHKVLEKARFSPEIEIDVSPAYLDEAAQEELGREVVLHQADYERAACLLGNFSKAPVAAALSQADAEGQLLREQGFSTLLDVSLLGGFIDVLCRTADGMLVVDYKTDRIEDDAALEQAAQHHAGQMAAYALAAGRMDSGGPVEVVLVFLDRPGAQVSRRYSAADIPAIEAELAEMVARMGDGLFEPLDAVDYGFCPGCAGYRGEYPLCATAARAITKQGS